MNSYALRHCLYPRNTNTQMSPFSAAPLPLLGTAITHLSPQHLVHHPISESAFWGICQPPVHLPHQTGSSLGQEECLGHGNSPNTSHGIQRGAWWRLAKRMNGHELILTWNVLWDRHSCKPLSTSFHVMLTAHHACSFYYYSQPPPSTQSHQGELGASICADQE